MDVNTCLATTIQFRELALYANLVPAIASLILAAFVILRASDRPKAYLFAGFAIAFSLWLAGNSILWNANNYYLVAGFWSSMNYFELLFFLLLFSFFYLDIYGSIRHWLSGIVLVSACIPFVINLRGKSVEGFYQAWCNMNNSVFLNAYDFWAEVIILFAVLCIGGYQFYSMRRDRQEAARVGMTTAAIVLFMGVFSGAEYFSSATNNYSIELYALFTLPVFVLFLTIIITNYGTFRLGDTIAKVLFYIFILFSGSEFFFVTSIANFVLTCVAFLMTICFGLLLLRSFQREALALAKVEVLAGELQDTNRQQESLLHFISHEIKGYLTKNEAAFDGIRTGDYGEVSPQLHEMSTVALADTRKGVATVIDILDASNMKKGTVAYIKKQFDLVTAIEEVVQDLIPTAREKGLELTFQKPVTGAYMFNGDKDKIVHHVIRNVVDNSIKYTPSGAVKVDIVRTPKIYRITIIDTGVGITPEDMARLFTEGGHGKDSILVNVHSTGYGLYIAKQVVEAHGGKIWAESEGAGKGSRFVIELPIIQ